VKGIRKDNAITQTTFLARSPAVFRAKVQHLLWIKLSAASNEKKGITIQ